METKKYSAPKIAVIPAAGKGTRFLPSTKVTPKEMHPLLNKPLIHHCLEELRDAGVEKVIIVNHPSKTGLEDYFKPHTKLRDYVNEELAQRLDEIESLPKVEFVHQKEQLGLAHAISCAKDAVGDSDFFVLLPDEIFIPETIEQNPCVELKESFEKSGSTSVTLLEIPHEEVSQYGVVELSPSNDIINILEKPSPEETKSSLILPGRYLVKNDIFYQIENTPKRKSEVQFTDSLLMFSENLKGVTTKCPRFDGGSVLGFLKANIYMSLKDDKIKDEIKTFISTL